MNFLRANESGVLLTVHAQPKASRTKIVGIHGESLKIAVQAPPVDGAANEALVEFLAGFFGCAPSQVGLKSGAAGRKKVFLLPITMKEAICRLETVL